MNFQFVIYSILILAALGAVLGLLIALTAKFLAVQQDPRIEKIASLLPGANCGGCGFAGCADFAKAVAEGRAEIDRCPVCPKADKEKIAEFLGLKLSLSERKVAVVLCGGDNTFAKFAAEYNGINDCRAANLVAGGAKACKAGCLGLGSCARVCPVGAIEIFNGLAIVHPNICISCGKCVKTCPRNLIIMVRESAKVHVFCSSKEKGADKRKKCEVACIACRKCVKAAGENEMLVDGFLVRTNYEKSPSSDLPQRAGCPTNCIQNTYPYAYIKKSSEKKTEEKVA